MKFVFNAIVFTLLAQQATAMNLICDETQPFGPPNWEGVSTEDCFKCINKSFVGGDIYVEIDAGACKGGGDQTISNVCCVGTGTADATDQTFFSEASGGLDECLIGDSIGNTCPPVADGQNKCETVDTFFLKVDQGATFAYIQFGDGASNTVVGVTNNAQCGGDRKNCDVSIPIDNLSCGVEDPTPAPEQPTAAPEPPTAAPEPPTAAPEPPTAAPEPPTTAPDTPETPTAAPEPPTSAPDSFDPAEVMGDPHLKSWGGKWFDYMGQCDLKLMHAPKFDGKQDMEIHIRTTIRYDYSFVEAAALRIGDDILEVGSFGDFSLNGVDGAMRTDHMVPKIGGYEVYYTTASKKQHKFDIVIGENKNVTISTYKDWVSVKVFNGDEAALGQVSGLMGTFDGKMLNRNGADLENDIDAFGQSWQVRPEEGNFFRTVRAPQYPEVCKLPTPEELTSRNRRLGEAIARQSAEKACAHLEGSVRSFCIHDVMATGDLEMANAGAF